MKDGDRKGQAGVNTHCEVMSVYRPSGTAGNAPVRCHQAPKEPQ